MSKTQTLYHRQLTTAGQDWLTFPVVPRAHRHMWMVEQQTGHKYCHMCGVHAPDSQAPCADPLPRSVTAA